MKPFILYVSIMKLHYSNEQENKKMQQDDNNTGQ